MLKLSYTLKAASYSQFAFGGKLTAIPLCILHSINLPDWGFFNFYFSQYPVKAKGESSKPILVYNILQRDNCISHTEAKVLYLGGNGVILFTM